MARRVLSKRDVPSPNVTHLSAALLSPCPRCIAPTTESPLPIRRPMPVESRKTGEAMLTAANAALPTPRPTKMPSAMLNSAENVRLNIVGAKYDRKRRLMSVCPKSSSLLLKVLMLSDCY